MAPPRLPALTRPKILIRQYKREVSGQERGGVGWRWTRRRGQLGGPAGLCWPQGSVGYLYNQHLSMMEGEGRVKSSQEIFLLVPQCCCFYRNPEETNGLIDFHCRQQHFAKLHQLLAAGLEKSAVFPNTSWEVFIPCHLP